MRRQFVAAVVVAVVGCGGDETQPFGPSGECACTSTPGPAGADGKQGPQGPAGVPGTPGVKGPAGDPGAPGLPGAEGPAGPVGAAGPPGAPGAAGPAGIQGPPGVNGTPGAPGAPGPKGADGPPGPGATQADYYAVHTDYALPMAGEFGGYALCQPGDVPVGGGCEQTGPLAAGIAHVFKSHPLTDPLAEPWNIPAGTWGWRCGWYATAATVVRVHVLCYSTP